MNKKNRANVEHTGQTAKVCTANWPEDTVLSVPFYTLNTGTLK